MSFVDIVDCNWERVHTKLGGLRLRQNANSAPRQSLDGFGSLIREVSESKVPRMAARSKTALRVVSSKESAIGALPIRPG